MAARHVLVDFWAGVTDSRLDIPECERAGAGAGAGLGQTRAAKELDGL